MNGSRPRPSSPSSSAKGSSANDATGLTHRIPDSPHCGSQIFAEAYTANTLNQYTAISGTPLSYDRRGNLTFDGAFTYAYNTENQLLSAARSGISLSFVHDAVGRRLWKHVTQGATTTSTAYLSVGDQEMAEFSGVGTVYLRKSFVHGAGIDEPVASIDPANVRAYHFADALGSVIALANPAGLLTEKHAYTAYGLETFRGANTASFRFAGRRIDLETGLSYNRARYYSPALGRFLQTDPIGTAGGINLYAYTGNDPVNLVDPTGKWGNYGFSSGGGGTRAKLRPHDGEAAKQSAASSKPTNRSHQTRPISTLGPCHQPGPRLIAE